jgi:DNA-binding response OmpR family regulator
MPTSEVEQAPRHVVALTTDAAVAQQLITGLRAYGIEVVATAELRNAIALSSPLPDLLLIDAPLPDYSLLETVHQLRMAVVAPPLPLLVLTTVETPGYQPLWQQVGATATLMRPISFKQLAAFIQAHCGSVYSSVEIS